MAASLVSVPNLHPWNQRYQSMRHAKAKCTISNSLVDHLSKFVAEQPEEVFVKFGEDAVKARTLARRHVF